MNRRLGSAWGLPEICRILDMCHTSPSVADFELCEPVNKNYPLLKTLVSRLTSTRSQAGNLSKYDHDHDHENENEMLMIMAAVVVMMTGIHGFESRNRQCNQNHIL